VTSHLGVLTRLLIGALTEAEAAEALDVPITEVQRLRCAVAADGAKLVPISVDLEAQRFEFLNLAGATFHEPFFGDTIKRARRERPRTLNFEVDFKDFVRGAEHHRRPPEGFVFHVGRCGSTLLANMLSASGEHLIIKEPDIVSDLLAGWLGACDKAARGEIELLLAAAIRYLVGAAGAANAARYRVLKLAAWNVRLAWFLLDLFPATPAVFLYRSPIETVASLLFQRPAWFDLIERPRSIQARFFPTLRDVPDTAVLSPAALFAHAWRSAADAALALPAQRLLVIQNGALIGNAEATIRRVLSHFRQAINPALIEAMAAARVTYSKDPLHRVQFDPSGEHRRPPLSSEQADEVRAITADHWHRLDARSALAGL
jgi:hypothetical protein